ncbi:MAG: hypothetical protein V2A64_04940 [Candidatus Omnitrophota bacterium]
METFDLGIAWDRELDNEFVEGLNNCALKEGLRPYLLHGYNFYTFLKDVSEGNIYFRFFLNRTSGDDSVFSGLPDFLKRKGITFINHPERTKESGDKFKMHLKFNSHDMPVSKTVLISPQEDRKTLELKMKYLSKPFMLKPADGLSENGVIADAHSLADVVKVKERHKDIRHIAQEKILPKKLGNKPAWFRVFYACANITPCWWHPVTHVYDILTLDEAYALGLSDIWVLTKRINQICKLDFFSTEMVMKNDGKLVIVDYVNYQPHMRRKSKFNDGVPDEIVNKVIEKVISFVKTEN